jgi:hypothetical protein
VCPENRAVVHPKEEGVTFSETETDFILQGTPKEQLPSGLVSKLQGLNMDGYYSVLSRNLGVLIKK